MKNIFSVLILGLLLGTGIIIAQEAQPAAPETPTSASAEQDLAAALQANPDFSDYVKYLQQSGMFDTINDQCPATLFVPVNSAFSTSDPFKDLGEDQTKLSDALKGYMVQGSVTAEQLSGMQTVTTLGGNDLPVTTGQTDAADTKNMNLSVGGTALDTESITTSNGCTIYPIKTLFSQQGM